MILGRPAVRHGRARPEQHVVPAQTLIPPVGELPPPLPGLWPTPRLAQQQVDTEFIIFNT